MTIISLDEHIPHIAGPVVCTRCLHNWVAVRPVDTVLMECPACGASRGANLDTMLDKPHTILGDQCCGQRDGDGACAAPACFYGDVLRLIHAIRDAYLFEHGTHASLKEPRT